MPFGGEHHYALDAASLLDVCRRHLRAVTDEADARWTTNLSDLDGTLHSVERLIHFHLLTLLEREEDELARYGQRCGGGGGGGGGNGNVVGGGGNLDKTDEDGNDDDGEGNGGSRETSRDESLMGTARRLREASEKKRRLGRSRAGHYARERHRQSQLRRQRAEASASASASAAGSGSVGSGTARRIALSGGGGGGGAGCAGGVVSPLHNHLQSSRGRYGRRRAVTPSRFAPGPTVGGGIGVGGGVDAHFPEDLVVTQRAGDSSCSLPSSSSSLSFYYSSSPSSSAISGGGGGGGKSLIHRNRSAEDSLLFRLIVLLQLCQVRIEDADRILCGRRSAERRSRDLLSKTKAKWSATAAAATATTTTTTTTAEGETLGEGEGSTRRERRMMRWRNNESISQDRDMRESSGDQSIDSTSPPMQRGKDAMAKVRLVGFGIVGVGAAAIFLRNRYDDPSERRAVVVTAGKAAAAATAILTMRRGWVLLGVSARLSHSATALDDWQHQWVLVQSTVGSSADMLDEDDEDGTAAEGFIYQAGGDVLSVSGGGGGGGGPDKRVDVRQNRLLELIELQGTTSSVWHSYGAVRFMLLKRVMDTFYASVGAAMNWAEKQERLSRFWMPIAAAAAASYYTVTGPGTKSAEVVSLSSPDFIKKAWGVVSLPAVKHLSLHASRILKGAAIADRITIADVPCIVLSRNQCQPLATALKRFWRKQEREMSHLSTIMESTRNLGRRQRVVNAQDYPEMDVILHLTGGGFFAHTIAGDLPYLLDWSGATNAVVLCPEYALLPEHCFPVAIDQICTIYCALLSGDAAPMLGFRVDKIIVTGEAAGGNLAAALCVKLCTDRIVDVETVSAKKRMAKMRISGESYSSIGEDLNELQSKVNGSPRVTSSPAGGPQCECEEDERFEIRLPDGLMLCCPALNMSLELTPSRVRGTNDPVLPSGLIKAISDGYLPPRLGLDKTDPVVSPYYASDSILRVFPPTFLCESTEDPLLDDSVYFNTRLRKLGVESDLRAAHNMPHAYWGLVTAGFPEARQLHTECQDWLVNEFQRGRRRLSRQTSVILPVSDVHDQVE